MKITLIRTYNNDRYCIGHLYIDGKFYMDTLEDCDRGLDQKMTLDKIKSLKKKSITAIPTGTYKITINVVSPKYSKKQFFNDYCKGKMPRLLEVKGYEGILMHPGNSAKDSDGCILVGENKVKGGLINSTKCFIRLYDMMREANKKKEDIVIEIVRKY